MNAPVLRSGTMTMQCACSSISCGIPLSGADITSENTVAASFRRFAGSLSLARSGAIATAAMRRAFISLPFSAVRVSHYALYKGTLGADGETVDMAGRGESGKVFLLTARGQMTAGGHGTDTATGEGDHS